MRSLEFEDVLKYQQLDFAAFIDEDQKKELYDFWKQLREENHDNISSADIDAVLSSYIKLGLLVRTDGAEVSQDKARTTQLLPAIENTDILMVLSKPAQPYLNKITGGF